MRRVLVLFMVLNAGRALAFHDTACAEKVWLAKGLFRKYEIKYTTVDYMSSKASTDESATQVTTKSSLQNSTASLDPGITTGQSISTTQYSFSFGDCSAWADNKKWVKREVYVAENMGQIRRDVAKGGGEYVETIAYLSGCPVSAKDSFTRLLHSHYEHLFGGSESSRMESEGWRFGSDIDGLLRSDSYLRNSCDVFSGPSFDS